MNRLLVKTGVLAVVAGAVLGTVGIAAAKAFPSVALPRWNDDGWSWATETLPTGEACESGLALRVPGRVSAVLEDGEGTLWVGTADAGLWRKRAGGTGKPEPIRQLKGREAFINALALLENGQVAVGSEGGLYVVGTARGNRITRVLPHETRALLRTQSEPLTFAATRDGLYRLSVRGSGVDAVRIDWHNRTGELSLTALTEVGGDLWMGTSRGAYVASLEALHPGAAPRLEHVSLVLGPHATSSTRVTGLARLGPQVVIGSDGGGLLFASRDDVTAEARALRSLRFDIRHANAIAPGAMGTDANGAVWMGTQGAGWLQLRDQVVDGGAVQRQATRSAALASAAVTAGFASPDKLLLGTAEGSVVWQRCSGYVAEASLASDADDSDEEDAFTPGGESGQAATSPHVEGIHQGRLGGT